MASLRALLGVIATLALAAGAYIALSGTLIFEDPQPRMVLTAGIAKPVLPKLATDLRSTKPGALDLVEIPAPVSGVDPADPFVGALNARLDAAVAEAGDAGVSAVLVVDQDGRIVYDRNGAAPLIPASTAKLVTAAAALTAFGPDHRFTTVVAARVAPDADGVIAGDLVLLGGGDPSLVSPRYVEEEINPERPQTPISALIAPLVSAGITRIEGDVVGDGSYLQGPALARGWPQRYLDDRDASYTSGLTIDQGLELIEIDGRLQARAVQDMAQVTAAVFREALVDAGIEVVGQPASADLASDTELLELGRISSPPMSVLLTRIVQNSDNHMADTIFRAVGRRLEGVGAFDDGDEQTRRLLAELQLDFADTELADGSGLSRESQITPALLTVLNYRMSRSSVADQWQSLMAVAGESGTLRRRLPNSIASQVLRGKTGSLQDVRALSGVVAGPDGQALFFTVTSNDLDGPQLSASRRLQDLIVLELAAQLYGCTRTPDPPAPEELDADEETSSGLPSYTCAG